ncbi:P-loop containing nucleoside triphosphate hydrolase protein [Russula earlei]|uniref:P-loop containing nucleoside triphosphate hydrolase protein n=1 Tax=Russula earlei TaxID=71964 RepID=A0ACC0UEC1_9AGAM|nr:P-loop containing nucleoside triphosphate hydrolase protein [Russula earlei]
MALASNVNLRPAMAMRVRLFTSQHAPDLFSPNVAEFIAAAGSVSSIPRLWGLPEVVVTGRANAGKSTLLNAVMKRKRLVASSKKPGRTKTLTFFRVGHDPGKLVLVDAPGYGNRGRPEWGQLFDQYLDSRRELRRVYILLNAKHGPSEADKQMLQHLDERVRSCDAKWTLQAIITKADLVSPPKLNAAVECIRRAILENAPTCLPPIVTASLKSNGLGVNDVRRSIVEACGLD